MAGRSEPTGCVVAQSEIFIARRIAGDIIEGCNGINCVNFSQIGTSTSAQFEAMGLAPSTSYNFRVRATDGAGNLSNYSNTATLLTTVVGAICD